MCFDGACTWQNLSDFVVSDEAAEISARHAEVSDDVREL